MEFDTVLQSMDNRGGKDEFETLVYVADPVGWVTNKPSNEIKWVLSKRW